MIFPIEIAFGIPETFIVLVEAPTAKAALKRANYPDDELRETIEKIMRGAGVDPHLHGWHNYEVLGVDQDHRIHKTDYYD